MYATHNAITLLTACLLNPKQILASFDLYPRNDDSLLLGFGFSTIPPVKQKSLVTAESGHQVHTKAGHSRDILYPILILKHGPNLIRQLARNFNGIQARNISIQTLPLCHPRLGRVRDRNDAFKHLRRTALNLVLGSGKMKKVFAIRASFITETLYIFTFQVSRSSCIITKTTARK